MVGQCSGSSNPGRVFSSPMEAVVVEVALIAQMSLVRLFSIWGSLPCNIYMLPNVQGIHQSFPYAKLNEATESVAENKDASESGGDEDSDASVGDSDMSEDENNSDDEGSSDSYTDGDSDDSDDYDNDEEDSDDEDADADSGDDNEDDEEEEKMQLPIKKKK